MFTRFTFGDFIKDKQSVTVAECLLRKWISVFGKIGTLHSDGGGEFDSEELTRIAEYLDVVYEATVKQIPSGKTETYTGVTARTFKQRLYEHRADTRKESSRIKTCLSSHIWDLKDQNIQYEVSWKLKERGTAFNPTTKKCRICLKEKFHIMYNPDGSSLNKRSEVFNTCRHRKKMLLELANT